MINKYTYLKWDVFNPSSFDVLGFHDLVIIYIISTSAISINDVDD